MRVNPFYTYNLASALSSTSDTIDKLTQQISSGSRVNSLSDDPVAAAQNEQILSQLAKDDTFTSKTSTQVEGMMQVADSALSSVVSQLNTAISVSTQGNNGTNSSYNLQAIANQLIGIRDEVVALGNTSYLGQYIFSGGKTSTVPFDSAGTSYSGDSTITSITTPNGQTISTNLPGTAIFMNSTSGNVLGTLNTLISEFTTAASAGSTSSNGTAIASSITQLTASLNNVSAQRVTLDNSLSRVQNAVTAANSEATQLLSAQTNLMQADLGQLATQLSTTKSQQTALENVLAGLGSKSLFDYMS
jgi:flagellar hook-associated protein 3 FlgL